MNHLPEGLPLSRRRFLGVAAMSVAAARLSVFSGAIAQSSEETEGALMSRTTIGSQTTEIRPFNVNFPEADLADLRRRIAAVRWTSEELVDDRSQGVQQATMEALARYWTTGYDWRRAEARLNALPQFKTE